MPIEPRVDSAHGLAVVGGEPHVFHCHHYNCFLQKTIWDQQGLVDAEELLTSSAGAVTSAQLRELKADRATAEELFRTLGFGTLSLLGVSADGGTVQLGSSHYAMGWLSKFGRSQQPVCFFAAGFAEAAARHLTGSTVSAREVRCVAAGDKRCEIELVRGGKAYPASPGVGALATFPPRPPAATRTSVDEAAIIAACAQLPLAGDAEGLVHAFGVSLTRHYANYYNLLSYRFDQEMQRTAGEAAALAARLLLVEAGRVCAFHTFGGIMESAEWEALIKPQCKTREDWLYGMVAVVNSLGWGRWSISELVPGERLELVVDGSYESNGHLAAFGTAAEPRCFLATGGTAGLMNLLYNADITQRPDLTPEFYTQTFQRPGFFVGREVECRSSGAPQCRFVAERS